MAVDVNSLGDKILGKLEEMSKRQEQQGRGAGESIGRGFDDGVNDSIRKINASSIKLSGAFNNLRSKINKQLQQLESDVNGKKINLKIDFSNIDMNSDSIQSRIQQIISGFKDRQIIEFDTKGSEQQFNNLISLYVKYEEKLKSLQQIETFSSTDDAKKNLQEQIVLGNKLKEIYSFLDRKTDVSIPYMRVGKIDDDIEKATSSLIKLEAIKEKVSKSDVNVSGVENIKEILEAINGIKESLAPISEMFKNEGNSLKAMAENGTASFTTLSEAVNALYNNLMRVESAVDSISKKDFNINNITSIGVDSKGIERQQIAQYRTAISQMYSEITHGMVEDLKTLMYDKRLSTDERGKLGGFATEASKIVSMSKKDLSGTTIPKLQNVFDSLLDVRNRILNGLNEALQSISPNGKITGYDTDFNALREAIPNIGNMQAQADAAKNAAEQQKNLTDETNNAVNANKEILGYYKNIAEALNQIKIAIDPLSKAFSAEGSLFNQMATNGSSAMDMLIEKLKEAVSLSAQLSSTTSSHPEVKAEEYIVNDNGQIGFNLDANASNSAERTTQSSEKEAGAFKDVADSAKEAAKSKSEFVDANKKAKQSTDTSVPAITAEKKALDEVAKSADDAAAALDKKSKIFVGDEDEPTKIMDTSTVRKDKSYQTTTETYLKNGDGDYDLITTQIVDDFKKVREEAIKTSEKIEKSKLSVQKYLSVFKSKTAGRTDFFPEFEQLKNLDIRSLSDVEHAAKIMADLEAQFNGATSNLRDGQSAFNPFVNAMRGIDGMRDEMDGVAKDFDKLAAPSKKLNDIFDELKKNEEEVAKAISIDQKTIAYAKWAKNLKLVNSLIAEESKEESASFKLSLNKDRQMSLLTKQQEQWNKSGVLTDEIKSKISSMFEELVKVSNGKELIEWKNKWAILKDEVLETKYAIEAAKNADAVKQKNKAALEEQTGSSQYWDSAFKESLSKLTDNKNPELIQLKEYMLSQAEQTRSTVLERYSAIMTIVSEKNKSLAKLMAAKGAEEKAYWQNQYSAWYGAEKAIDFSWMEDSSNQAIIGAKNVAAFNDELERSAQLEAKNKDAQYAQLTSLYDKQAKSIAEQEKLQAQINSGKTGEAQKAVLEEKLLAEKKVEEEILKQILSYGDLQDAAKQTEIIEKARAAALRDIAESQAKEEDKTFKQNANYGRSTFNSATRKYDNTMATYADIDDGVASPQLIAAMDSYVQKYKDLIAARQKFIDTPSLADNQEEKNAFNSTAQAVEDARKKVQEYIDSISELNKAREAGTLLGQTDQYDPNGILTQEEAIKQYTKEIFKGKLQITGWNDEHTKLYGTLNKGKGVIDNVTAAIDGGTNTLFAYRTATKETGTAWSQFLTGIKRKSKEISGYLIGAGSIYRVISQLRKGIQYVKDIDLALTELKKVTNETDETYAKFLQTASKTGAVIGSTVADFTNATANFARLGYSISEAAQLAEAASIYKNVGDGIDSVDQASESIISTMKAFGIEANNSMSIVDKFNEVGNRFAISSTGIGDALQKSASALYESGNTIDESIALITAANSVVNLCHVLTVM